jgi:hypothetical protein
VPFSIWGGNISFEDDPLSGALDLRVWDGNCGEEGSSIRMEGILVKFC